MLAACGGGARPVVAPPPAPVPAPAPPPPVDRAAEARERERLALTYAGVDARGIPHYAMRTFSEDERHLLLSVYGVVEPARLYLSDSSATRVLKYDTRPKTCRGCYVNSYRLGFVSVRRPGETWDAVEQRVRGLRPRDFAPGSHTGSTSLDALDPDIGPAVIRLLDDARRAGFRLRIAATYRSPEREAAVMAAGTGRTHTLTSLHSYGRAIDVDVLDERGRALSPGPRWIAFRRWVVAYPGDVFRILGTPSVTWDWRHVEMPGPEGFRSIEAAIERARACSAAGATVACDFAPHLRPGVAATR